MRKNPTPKFGRRPITAVMVAFVAIIAAAVFLSVEKSQATEAVVYMSPRCDCCGKWVDHLRQNGFSVEGRFDDDLDAIKAKHGVPAPLASCHTALIEGLVIEGHVPATDIRRLLGEKLAARGLAAPGMPAGAPGMETGPSQPYEVLLFDESGQAKVFASH